MDIIPGQIVISKAGRDKGKKFIVLSIEKEDSYVYIADGNLRKVENPKRKKIRHLVITGKEVEKLAEKLNEGKALQNSEIFKEIKRLDHEESI